MKSITLIIFILTGIVSVSHAQTNLRSVAHSNEIIRKINNNKTKSLNGDFYLDEWKAGSIFFSESPEPLTAYKLRYFVYGEVFHLLSEKNDTLLLKKSHLIDSIIINDKKYIQRSYIVNNKIKQSYFEELSNGKMNLLKKHSNVFVKNNDRTATGYDTRKPDTYKIESTLYYQYPDKIALQLPTKRKKIIQLLHDDRLMEFLQSHKLNIRKEKDLIKLFNYYNTLN